MVGRLQIFYRTKLDNWKYSVFKIFVFQFCIKTQLLRWDVNTLIMHMCLIHARSPFLYGTYSISINSSRAVSMLCLTISIDFLLWTALTTKSRTYKNNLRVWKVASCVFCCGWHSEKEFVKVHLSCVVSHWDYKNRSTCPSMIYELNKTRDQNVSFAPLLFLSQPKDFFLLTLTSLL